VRSENRDPSGTVRLGAPSSLADIFYAPLAQIFTRRFPRVRLELSEGLTETMCDHLLRAELDIAIVTTPQPNDHIDYETLVVEPLFLIGPPRDPRLKRGRLTRKEFKDLPAAVVPLSRNPFPPDVPFSLRVDSSTPFETDRGLGAWLRAVAVLGDSPGSGGRHAVGGSLAMDARRPRPRPAARPAR
jgi:LysR family nitrogen assimilation transcriptional regulator